MQPALPAAVPCVRGALQPRRFLLLFFDPAKIQDLPLHPSFPHRPNLALLLRFSRSCGYFLCTGRFCAVLGLKKAHLNGLFLTVLSLVGCLPYLRLHLDFCSFTARIQSFQLRFAMLLLLFARFITEYDFKKAVLHLRKTTELCLLSCVLQVRKILLRDIFFHVAGRRILSASMRHCPQSQLFDPSSH